MVPEAGRVRRRRLDGAPVLRQHRVLRRLRPLRRAHDGAVGLDRRRHRRRAVAHATSGRHQTTHRYAQDDVHDFAWTTSPDFIERGSGSSMPGCRRCRCGCCCSPNTNTWPIAISPAAAAALRYYGEWFGPYPYPPLTIVDPAFQSESGGMEYPTLFTGGTRWLSPRHSNDPEYVVIHEAGHQFWYGMVANNEIEYAWLDEGINEYARFARAVGWRSSRITCVQRFFGDFIPVAVSRHRAEARHRHQLDEHLSAGARSRLALDADRRCCGPARIRTCRTTRRR